MRDGLLFAQAFDLQTLRITGESARIADGVGFYESAFGYAAIDASANGVIAVGPALRTTKVIQTFDRNGNAIGRSLEGPFASPRLAPDQRTIVVSAKEAGANADIWAIDLVRGNPSRVTSDLENDYFPDLDAGWATRVVRHNAGAQPGRSQRHLQDERQR